MEEKISHSRRQNNFINLMNIIIDTGKCKEGENPTYTVYHNVDEENHFVLSYDTASKTITIYYRTDTSDVQYSVLIDYAKFGVPSVFAAIKKAGVEEASAYGYLPVNGMYMEKENTAPMGKEFSKVVNAEFAVADFLLEKYTGFTFADFGMNYER